MNREKWNKAGEIFERALEVESGAREGFIRDACGTDATLLAEVHAFLAAYDTESFLERRQTDPAFAATRIDEVTHTDVDSIGGTRVTRREREAATGEPLSPSLASGVRRLGPYRILGVLGEGGMGVVFRGQHDETGELAAVKTVRIASEALLESFRREVHALTRLRHPGIVRVLDDGVHDGLPWYAMELLDGVPLRAFASASTRRLRLTRGEPPSGASGARDADAARPPAAAGRHGPRVRLADALTLAHRLCSPLAFLHGEGIVHRDLKPDNVLILSTGLPVIVDFGVASFFAGREGREALAALGAAGGTVAYMAPEQIRGDPVDARVDLYALGCILYELLAGRPPFVCAGVEEYRRAHLYESAVPPSTFAPEVSAALDALVLRLLAKRPTERIGHADDVAAALTRLGTAQAATDADTDAPRPRAYLYRPAFVGRGDALAEFDGRLAQLDSGQGGIVLVSGESGVGKTRLVVEVGRKGAWLGARVLAGECTPPRGREASGGALNALLQPLRRVADRCHERGEREADRLLGPRAKLLARYEPALADVPGQGKYPEPADLQPEAARLRLFEALAETFVKLAAERPLVLILDDLQWADDLTLGLLEFVARTGRFAKAPVLAVGTYRAEEEPEAMRRILAGAWRVGLERLDDEAITAMAGGMLALEPPPRLLGDYLARQSEGNPFFVTEYLRAAVEEGLLWRDETGAWRAGVEVDGSSAEPDYGALGLPVTIRALVEHRLGELTADATAVTRAGAVLGREADPALMKQVAGLEGPAFFEAVEGLLRRQILEDTADGRLRFTHDKLREAAYDALAPKERARLHRAAARALEASRSPQRADLAATLGHHWERAGDPERARGYYLTAARDAAERYAHTEAERLYRAFLALSDVATPERVQARVDLAGGILRLQGRIDEGVEICRAALDDTLALGRRDLEATTRRAMGVLLREGSLLEEAGRMFEACIAASRACGNRYVEGAAIDGLGSVALQQGRLRDAERFYRQAGAILAEIGDRRQLAVSMANLAMTCSEHGRHDEACDLIEQALAIDRAIGNRTHEGISLTNLGTAQSFLDRFVEAIGSAEAALVVHRETGYRQFEGLTLSNLADFYMRIGQPEQAAARCREAIDVLETAGDTYFLCMAISNFSSIIRVLGEYERAERYARRALQLSTEHAMRIRSLLYACDLAFAELAQGRAVRDRLAEIEAGSLDGPPESELASTLARLRRAVEAFERGEKLVHGEHPDDAFPWARGRGGEPTTPDDAA